MSATALTARPAPDQVLVDIADYVANFAITSDEAYRTAHYDLLDTLGCGFEALAYPACTKLLGPVVPGTIVPNGAKVPGTPYQLDPVQAAFNLGAMVRWLDFNDTWLAAEWGHPSDNLGGILMTADWLSRSALAHGRAPLPMGDVLTEMIKAHEIQGVIALENSFNRVGLDHVVLVKLATTAVVATLTSTTWSRPTRLKLFCNAITPWISCALIIAVSTSRTVSGARPDATALRDIQSAVIRMPPRLSDG